MNGAVEPGDGTTVGLRDDEVASPETPYAERREAPRAAPPERRHWPFWPAVVVMIGTLLVAGALALISNALYNSNEKKLLQLRARELAAVLTVAGSTRETPLASAAALADATNGNVHKFMRFAGPYAGTGSGQPFVSISLWHSSSPQTGPVAVVGIAPVLNPSSAQARAFFAQALRIRRLAILPLLDQPAPRIGYAVTSPGPTSGFTAYGESALPADRQSRLRSNQAFSELNYAIYLGPAVRAQNLLVTNLRHPPITGQRSTLRIPFGNTDLTTVVAARQSLAGSLPLRLPWIILIAGAVLAIGAGALAVRLIERRRSAEHLADRLEGALKENRRLYAEQRNIAQTLQHALLPDQLPELQGAEASARYVPGEQGVEIGGDWYDVLPVDEQRLLVVVGDVTGHGLRAAATMAALRFAIHAYAAQKDPPETILTKLSGLLNVGVDGQMATVLCALIDLDTHTVTVASAGHLPPLIISGPSSEYLEGEVGPPIGVHGGSAYTATTVVAPSAATFLAFTDGLVERRDEPLDDSLARLRAAASENHMELAELLSKLVELRHEPAEDDTAIVGLRWKV